MVFWDDLGFATNYTVDADIQYPGDGEWMYPEHRVVKPGSDLIGGPQALIHPALAEPWLLVTAFTGLGALYATADPEILCVFEQFERVVFVNVEEPSMQLALDDIYPVRIAASVDQGLLLVSDWSGITAIGVDGVRWRAPNLTYDIHITRADGERIYFRGTDPGESSETRGSLDARTGGVISP
jgi:hypothetical protein